MTVLKKAIEQRVSGAVPAPIRPDEIGDGWHNWLLLNDRKTPQPILANAMSAIRHAPAWTGVLGFDIFAHRTVALKAPPWAAKSNAWIVRPWSDRDDMLATEWLQHCRIAVGVETTQRAIETVAMGNAFHPIEDYLGGLRWDGKQRLDVFVALYLGAEPSEYGQAVGRCALVGAVARIRQPGCKLDTVPIIEGPQGIRKSTAVRTLGGPWFTDEISDFGSKDAAMQVASAWFIEIGELDAMSKAETSRIKAFISRTTDRYRPPFGRRIIESKRPSVFWGTTNSDAYLKDETGARRFWPIKAGRIDIDAIGRDRDQLFAEAVHLYSAGEPWWMNGASVEQHARAEQRTRYIEDPWQTAINRYVTGREDVSINEVLVEVLKVPVDKFDQRIQNRVVICLKQLAWVRFRKRVKGKVSPEWRYRRSACERTI